MSAIPLVGLESLLFIECILDEAFLDRVDIDCYIGTPGITARLEILKSCLRELRNKMVIQDYTDAPSDESTQNEWMHNLALSTDGFSARALRKLPIQAAALFLEVTVLELSSG
jgi:SpoVK/Ycf46/Vps4 family AAA+-type ATPase